MRSVSWAALLVPLLLSSLPATAWERTVERVSRKRTVHVPTAPGEALSELLVAGGTATVITADVPLGPGSPRLQDERGLVRLIPVDGSSFIVLPSNDLPEGERLPLTVPLRSGDSLLLTLVTRRGEVDGEVRLVRLQSPAAGGEGVVGVARLLNAAPEGQVGLALPGMQVRLREDIRAEVESVLRIGQHVFITLSTSSGWKSKPSARDWNRLQLRAALGDGSSVVLPLLHVPASPSVVLHAPQHTLVAIFPGGTLRVELVVEGANAPDAVLTLPLGTARTTP